MSVRIGLGLSDFPFADQGAFWRWIDRCEEGDVDSVWQTDRLLGPQPFLESMSTMAALAGGTERLKFGMNVVVVPFRDPLVLAKECATIDFLSGGRLLPAFGVGGPLAPEFRGTGRPLQGRGRLADEALDLMVRLWAGETVTQAGGHYRYEEAVIAPLPVQDPLPLWIGGDSASAIRRTARIGTGWLGGLHPPARVAEVVAGIRAALGESGRSIDEDHYGAAFAFRFGSWEDAPVQALVRSYARRLPHLDPHDYLAVGDAETIIQRVGEYRAAGASKFVLRPVAQGEGEVFKQTQRLLETVLPAVHEAAPSWGD